MAEGEGEGFLWFCLRQGSACRNTLRGALKEVKLAATCAVGREAVPITSPEEGPGEAQAAPSLSTLVPWRPLCLCCGCWWPPGSFGQVSGG